MRKSQAYFICYAFEHGEKEINIKCANLNTQNRIVRIMVVLFLCIKIAIAFYGWASSFYLQPNAILYHFTSIAEKRQHYLLIELVERSYVDVFVIFFTSTNSVINFIATKQ